MDCSLSNRALWSNKPSELMSFDIANGIGLLISEPGSEGSSGNTSAGGLTGSGVPKKSSNSNFGCVVVCSTGIIASLLLFSWLTLIFLIGPGLGRFGNPENLDFIVEAFSS